MDEPDNFSSGYHCFTTRCFVSFNINNRSLYSRGRINVVVLNSLFMTLNISGARVGAVRCIKIPLFYENKLQNGLNILIKKFNSYQKSKMVPDKNMFVPLTQGVKASGVI